MTDSLLPPGSGLIEKAMEASFASRWSFFADAVPAINTAKLVSPPISFLPYLVWEYGLGELTPYVPNLHNLLQEGIQWQRVRGTFAAVQRGLLWLNCVASIDEAWSGRRWWNSYQLNFASLPPHDDPDLERIEGVSRLSVPHRSQLRRGVYQYHAGASELDRSRLDGAMIERESGVAISPAATLWSFGRSHEVEHFLTVTEGTAMGNWIEPAAEMPLLWANMDYRWSTAAFPWSINAVTQRQTLMATWFSGRALYAALRDGAGRLIGHRRCRAVRPVSQSFAGSYSFAGSQYTARNNGTSLYVEAMTDFEDAVGVTAASWSLVVGANVAAGILPGRLWLAPGELVGGFEFAATALSIPLRATVRDQIKFMLRF